MEESRSRIDDKSIVAVGEGGVTIEERKACGVRIDE